MTKAKLVLSILFIFGAIGYATLAVVLIFNKYMGEATTYAVMSMVCVAVAMFYYRLYKKERDNAGKNL